MIPRRWVVLFCFGGALSGCATVPDQPAPEAPAQTPIGASLRSTALIRLSADSLPALSDDGSLESLQTAAAWSASYYRRLPPEQVFSLGQDTYSAREFADSLDYLGAVLVSSGSTGDWLSVITSDFIVYQSSGVNAGRKVTFSSYYEPTIDARLQRDNTFRYPLYARPPDLIDVDLGAFDPAYQGAKIVGKRNGRNLVPYASRSQIDSRNALADQGLEIAWAKNPLDIFFLQIEGSGWLDLGHGQRRRIRYDGTNGLRYRSVGQYLIASGRVTAKGFDHQAFERYMNRHPEKRQDFLNVNERYVFFKIDSSTSALYAYGNTDVPLTPGRSVATDPRFFPKGALAWISTEQSVLNNKGKVTGTKPLLRFVLNQDEGGAILGPGRVDYFAGSGPEAEAFAWHFWYPGKLYFLVRKKN